MPSARNDRGGQWWVLLLWQNRVPTLSGDRLSLYSDSFTAHWLFQDDLPVFGVGGDGLAGQDAACQHQAAELRFDGVLDIAAQGPGAVGRVISIWFIASIPANAPCPCPFELITSDAII